MKKKTKMFKKYILLSNLWPMINWDFTFLTNCWTVKFNISVVLFFKRKEQNEKKIIGQGEGKYISFSLKIKKNLGWFHSTFLRLMLCIMIPGKAKVAEIYIYNTIMQFILLKYFNNRVNLP